MLPLFWEKNKSINIKKPTIPLKDKIMKVLCFTTSYNRPKFLRACIFDIQRQSHKCTHAINIAYDDAGYGLENLYGDIDDLLIFNYNTHQHINHLNAIKSVDYTKFDIFIKIDDDDIYKTDYVNNIVKRFKEGDVDMVSSFVSTQLNGVKILKGNFDNLDGYVQDPPYHMPMTFAFNRKALDIILNAEINHQWEDKMWRNEWTKAGIRVGTVDNADQIIWNIHGANVSTFNFLLK